MGTDAIRRPSRFRLGRVVRSVRFKIILLLLVPLVSLSTLWAFAASITLGDGLTLRHVNTIQEHLGYPSGALGSALQQERRLSMVFLGSRSAGDRASMESGRLVTDRQADLFRRLATDQAVQGIAGSQAKGWTHQVLGHLNDLTGKRRAIDATAMSRAQAFAAYSDIIDDITALQSSLSTLSDPEVTQDSETQVALLRAREVLSQEDALLSGSLAAGQLTFSEHVQFTKLVGTQRTLYQQVAAAMRPDDRAYYQRIVATPEYHRLQSLENRFTDHMPASSKGMAGMKGGNALAGTAVEWKTTISSILTRMRGLELSATADAAQRAKPISDGIILRVTLAGALGLVAVILSLVLSLWVGRSVIRELTALRRAALDLANERLPSVIRRLRRGEKVDVTAEAPPLSFSTQEIDQVGQAFNAARRTAIQGAVEEAALRRSISDVFLNLARRNQTLLHRQLSLLDSMERRVTEPDELDDLFSLDHLATRMRRHAEGLIILSGQAAGRGWRNPVPAVDVARAAAAEVEDYARVTVTTMPRVSVAGPAVADLIHLMAELVENATLYSPPDTAVQVSGQVVAHGFAFEVEDRGLSMDAAALERANEQLADPPEFDLSNSAQLGLFVVGRLAQRHHVQVTLRTSPYGGTTAIVLLPDAIVVRGGEGRELEAGRPATTRRGEEALVPMGAIGPPTGYGGAADATGPIPAISSDRPPLPQRRSDAAQHGGYPAGPYDAKPYDAGAGPGAQGDERRPTGGPPAPDPLGTGTYGSFGTGTASPAPGSAHDADPYSSEHARGAWGAGHERSGTGLGDPAAPSYGAGTGTGSAGSGSYGGASYGTGSHGSGSSGGSYDTGSYDTGSSTTGSYDAGGHSTGSFPGVGASYSGTYESSGTYGTDPAADTGQWSAVGGEDTGDRPPLPRRSSGPAPSVFEPPPGGGGPPAPREPAAPPPPGGAGRPRDNGGAGGGTGRPALPRRVRQASLAPQLREEIEPVTAASDERSPEELRTMLSSIQKGWLRGRSDAEQTTTRHEEEDI